MQDKLIVGASPHLRAREGISNIMWQVSLALLPAVAVSLYFFGLGGLRTYVLSIASALAAEAVCLKMRGKPLDLLLDGSAFLTGLLFAMVIPPYVIWYVPVVGAAFAVAIVKQAFGGLGNNIWNPALSARIFVQFAYSDQLSLSKWPVPGLEGKTAAQVYDAFSAASPEQAADAWTMATPLAQSVGERTWSYLDLFMGHTVNGCLGETCKLALIAGGIYLIARHIIDWRIPAGYIGTVALLAWLLPLPEDAPAHLGDPLYQVLAGGLMLGAFYMATDMVTTPVTRLGRLVFGIGCGVLTAVIRRYGGYPEGVCYSIVLMNTATPLIDRWIKPRLYGSRTPKPGAESA
jgi:electron transport complex protein RnfD